MVRRTSVGLIVLGLAFSFVVPTALAVHDGGVFELGNPAGTSGSADILGSATQAGPDWADLFDASGHTVDPLPAGGIAAAFLADDRSQSSATDRTIFAGSNKNNDLTATWQWDTGNNPPKDDISNIYAYAAIVGGDLVVYAGIERLAPEGDSHVDVEFNQAGIDLDKDPECGSDGVAPPPPAAAGIEPGPPCEFVSEKTFGDVLVVMDFENGGALGFVEVRRWNGSEYVLELIHDGEGCNPSSAGVPADSVCAFNNGETIDGGPWPNYDRHGNVVTSFEKNGFTEFGVNITDLFGFGPCVTTIMGKTRTSPSFNSELKDFGGPAAFPLCGIAVEKTGDASSKVGDATTYAITITNTGAVTLYKQSIFDDVLGDLTDGTDANITSSTCGASLAAGASCTIGLIYTVPSGSPDPLVNTVTIVYDNKPSLSGTDVSATDDHSTNLFQPSVQIVKGGPATSKVGDNVHYTFAITNTSSTDSPELILDSIGDTVLGNLAEAAPAACDSLGPGESCLFGVDRTVQSGDPDPLQNTVTVHYHPKGFPNDIADSDDHSVNLFGPNVKVVKGGDSLGKIGDKAHYTFEITNTSSNDAPDLILDEITDTLLGNLADDAPASCDRLAPGASCSFAVDRTVRVGDPDPLVNTVSVRYHPEGFPNEITDSDGHSVNLFQPSVRIDKGGSSTSKVGDPVTYTFEVTNTSSSDSPDLIMDSISDTVLGNLADEAPASCDRLAPGGSCEFTVDRTVLSEDPDPLRNTVTVHYHPAGFPNDITDSDDHSVNLFGPTVTIEKGGAELSKVGDDVTYTFKITNTSTEDAPDLLLTAITDTVLGDLAFEAPEACDRLATGASCSFEVTRTVKAGDPDPLTNIVTVHYKPEGFPNDISDSDDHSVNLFQPGVSIVKTGDVLGKVGDEVTYGFTITNTSSNDSPDLVLDSITDTLLGDLEDEAPAACDRLAPGELCSFEATRTVQAGDPDPLPNTVTVHYHPDGFPNDITDSDGHSVNLFTPGVEVEKGGTELSKVGDPVTYSFTVRNTSSSDSPDLVLDSMTDSVLGDLTALAAEAGCGRLEPGESCTFTVSRTVASDDPDPTTSTVTVHYHPEGFANDITDTDDHSVNLFQPALTVDKSGPESVTVGDPLTYTFTITNTSSADGPPLELESMVDVGTGWPGLGDLTDEATAAGCGTLAPGASCTFSVTITAPASPNTLRNDVTVLYHPDGFPNDVGGTDFHRLGLIRVLPRPFFPNTGAAMQSWLALGVALVLMGAGLRVFVTFVPKRD